MPADNFTDRAVHYTKLEGLAAKAVSIQDLFKTEPKRLERFVMREGPLRADFSKQAMSVGPRLVADAFQAAGNMALDLRFAENVDGASINDALSGLDPKTTLVVVVSKSFTTQETRMNAEAARAWLVDALGKIDAFLKGAAKMDMHFRDQPLQENLPVMMALTGVWNRNVLGYSSQAVIPYARRIRKLAAFLQQLEMESNGKRITRDGKEAGLTCPIIWGDEGTNGQHAFFQWLHQGTPGAPVDFVAVGVAGELFRAIRSPDAG